MYEPPENKLATEQTQENNDLADVLSRAISALDSIADEFSVAGNELRLLQDRFDSGRFHLAVLGQFKRGKSTLLNTLLGDELLPTDILPVTAIPTFIDFAEKITVRVHFASEAQPVSFCPSAGRSLSDFLTEYVTETGNPDNKLQVKRVEIGHPAEILKQGVVLIDTPGIGSTHKHNTEVAYQVLPQCDAAIFLVSPDPPITEVELAYLQEIRQRLPRTFFLLNKVDFLDENEKTASLTFLAEQLTPLCDGVPQVLPVSARKGLSARLSGDAEGWATSGMQLVEQNLIEFFANEKQKTLRESLQRRVVDQLNNVVLQLQLSLSALLLPEAELRQRIDQFKQSLPAIERELLAAEDVLAGDLKRIVGELSSEVEDVRARAKGKIIPQLDNLVETISDTEDLEREVQGKLACEIPTFFAPVMREVTADITIKATELLSLHQDRCNELIEQVRKIAAELFSIPYCAPTAEKTYCQFEVSSWSNDIFISAMDPLGQRVSRKLFTQKFRRKKTVKRLQENSLKLLNKNVEQLNWSLRRSLDENFRQFGADLSAQLRQTIVATKQAMEIALTQQESQANKTSNRETKLKLALDSLNEIIADL